MDMYKHEKRIEAYEQRVVPVTCNFGVLKSTSVRSSSPQQNLKRVYGWPKM